MTTTVRRLTLLIALLALAAACGRLSSDDGDGPGSGGIDHPTGPDQLILRVATGGGFVPPEFTVRGIPEVTLTGDGRLITLGPQIEIYPGPALPNLLFRPITEEGIQAILEAARDAGLLGPDAQYSNRCIADAPTSTFVLVAGGRTHTVSVYALTLVEEGDQDCWGDPAERQAVAGLARFRDMMGDLSWLPEGSVGEEEEFAFDELRLFAWPAEPGQGPDTGIEPSFKEWPLGEPLAGFGEPSEALQGARCGTVSGADLETLLPELREANELTFWRSGGETYRLVLRPLLPDESGCPTS